MKVTVTCDWLAQNLSRVKVLDASWYLPNDPRDPIAEYNQTHIETAQFFDIDQIADTTQDLPHMIPSAKQFEAQMSALGLSNSDTIIIYDTAGLFSAARAWWLLRAMGHKNVFVLDGGFPKWLREGRSVSGTTETPTTGNFKAVLNEAMVVTAQDVLTTKGQVIDARPKSRFKGEAPEPRPNTRSGHIPNSTSLFFKDILNEDNTLKTKSELKEVFEQANIDLMRPTITSCGSGVTAAILTLALYRLDHKNTSLYDGSWSEWGARNDLPISTG